MAATQDALYAELDVELSWSERELPERERTKHVHRLHPYLGKFIPQLVEELLRRHVATGGRVLDPFAGSGTTLVQALESGHGRDRHRPRRVQLPADARQDGAATTRSRSSTIFATRSARFERGEGEAGLPRRATSPEWFAPEAAADLLRFRSLLDGYENADVLRIVLARAARSARLTTHFDLDFPSRPQREPYWCHKHKRECRPVERASHFLRRYTLDTLARLKEFASCGGRARRSSSTATPARSIRAGVRRRRHLAALPGADRLPRAAPLRLRAPRPRRPARERARRGGRRDEPRGARALRRRDRRRARSLGGGASARGAAPRRRERPPRALSRRCSSAPACGSTAATAGTSTAAPASAPASTSRTCSSRAARSARSVTRIVDGHVERLCCLKWQHARAHRHACARRPRPAGGSRSKRTSRAARRRSRSSGSPTAPARRRRSASAAASSRPSSTGPATASSSTSPRPTFARRAPASTCRSPWRCSKPRPRSRPGVSRATPRSASSPSTGGSGRFRARSSPPRGPAGAAPNGSSARPSPGRRSRSPGSSRCRCGTSPRRSPTSAATSRCLRRDGPSTATGRLRRPTSPTSAARSAPAGCSRSPRPVDTTSCSQGHRASGRRCSPAGCPGSCPASTTKRRSRSRGSTPSPGCSRPARAWSARRRSAPRTTRRRPQRSSAAARARARER